MDIHIDKTGYSIIYKDNAEVKEQIEYLTKLLELRRYDVGTVIVHHAHELVPAEEAQNKLKELHNLY